MFVYLVLLCYSFMNLHLYVNGFIFIIEYFNIIGYQFVIKKSQITNSKKKLHISMESQIVKKESVRRLAFVGSAGSRLPPWLACARSCLPAASATRSAARMAMTRMMGGRREERRRTRRGGGGGKGSGSGSEGMIQSYI